VEGDLRLGGFVDLSGFSSGVSVGSATYHGRLRSQEMALKGESATSRVSLTEIRHDDVSGSWSGGVSIVASANSDVSRLIRVYLGADVLLVMMLLLRT
jgi:hypothetical protein